MAKIFNDFFHSQSQIITTNSYLKKKIETSACYRQSTFGGSIFYNKEMKGTSSEQKPCTGSPFISPLGWPCFFML